VAGNAVKIAKLTVGHAYIGCVYVAVYLPSYFAVRYLLTAQLVGNEHKGGKRRMLKKGYAFLHVQKFKRQGFFVQMGYIHRTANLHYHSSINYK
jgi:hypothetical protein